MLSTTSHHSHSFWILSAILTSTLLTQRLQDPRDNKVLNIRKPRRAYIYQHASRILGGTIHYRTIVPSVHRPSRTTRGLRVSRHELTVLLWAWLCLFLSVNLHFLPLISWCARLAHPGNYPPSILIYVLLCAHRTVRGLGSVAFHAFARPLIPSHLHLPLRIILYISTSSIAVVAACLTEEEGDRCSNGHPADCGGCGIRSSSAPLVDVIPRGTAQSSISFFPSPRRPKRARSGGGRQFLDPSHASLLLISPQRRRNPNTARGSTDWDCPPAVASRRHEGMWCGWR